MDYLIEDMLDASARGSRKSIPPSPAPAEPPLPPSPPPIRKRKTKNVKFPESGSGNVAGSSKHSEIPMAAAIPLPDTPAPLTSRSVIDPSASVESEAPAKTAPEAVAGQSDYFSAAELAPSEEPRPGILSPSHTGGSTHLSPLSELPPPAVEISNSAEELLVADHHPAEPPVVAEEQEPRGDPVALEAMPKDVHDGVPPMIHVGHQVIPTICSQKAMLIGISGSPSSGKTTLAHLLSLVLPRTTTSFIIHQVDFFVPDHLIIPSTNGEPASHRHIVDLSIFKRFVEYSRHEGGPPPAFRSMQPVNQREQALSQIPPGLLEHLQSILAGVPGLQEDRPIGIVEGDLLYQSETIRSLLDIKILLRTSKEESRARRFDKPNDKATGHKRKSWDTRDYFNRTLWPHYAKEHAVLFDHGDVEDRPKLKLCQAVGITVQPLLNMGLDQTLRWMVDVICRESGEVAHRRDREVASLIDDRGGCELCRCNKGFLGRIRQTIFDFL
ncbi:MAG: hypothetical protein LQ337_008578 [Flavoplaca oasis]|nr:MAG: hypothetical protein LQ337_008578 [Flavoplaca oasis]